MPDAAPPSDGARDDTAAESVAGTATPPLLTTPLLSAHSAFDIASSPPSDEEAFAPSTVMLEDIMASMTARAAGAPLYSCGPLEDELAFGGFAPSAVSAY